MYSGRTGTLIQHFTGEFRGSGLGTSVSGVGDLDDDGYADLIAGAPGEPPVRTTAGGQAYVYSGRTGALLHQFTGEFMYSDFGTSVSGIGDLNSDGHGDLLVGAPGTSEDPAGPDAGRAFVFTCPHLPVAVDDYHGARGVATLVVVAPGVLVNDTDPNGDPLTAVLDTDAGSGALTLNADGSFSYMPSDPEFSGEDQFTYFANDGTSNSLTAATVRLLVKPGTPIIPGDFNEDGLITGFDLTSEIDALFNNGPDPTDGGCRSLPRGDFDCDGFSTALDLSGLIDHLFSEGGGPCDPCAP